MPPVLSVLLLVIKKHPISSRRKFIVKSLSYKDTFLAILKHFRPKKLIVHEHVANI